MAERVFYVGTEQEVSRHAQPLRQDFDVQIVEPERIAKTAGKDDLAIFFSEHFKRFRSAIFALKEVGCRTLYAIDGILEWRNAFENRPTEPACPWTMRPVLCDKVAAIGRSQARMLDFWGNKGKVELVGLPRLDDLSYRSMNNSVDPADSTNESLSRRRTAGEKDRSRVLVATAKWPAFTDKQQKNVEAALRCLKNWFEKQPQVEVVWRLTQDLDRKLELENATCCLSQNELVEQLAECDALITTPSTAMLEGMLLGKPTAILEFNDCPQINNVAWQIRHPDQVGDVMKELLDASPFKLAQQAYALQDTLECHTPALPRLTQLVQKLFQYPAGNAPSNLIPVESSDRISDLGSEFLFNGFRLAETSDETELKAQLAFMERELELLRARNELVESEFQRAKSTIDNVFNNPVVFPFIKAGEFAGRLFSSSRRTSESNQ